MVLHLCYFVRVLSFQRFFLSEQLVHLDDTCGKAPEREQQVREAAKDWGHDRLSHTNIKDDRLSHSSHKDLVVVFVPPVLGPQHPDLCLEALSRARAHVGCKHTPASLTVHLSHVSKRANQTVLHER
jgi:hypothetical protein